VFYRKFGGAVISTAIDQFVYITVNKKFDDRIRVSYSRTEEARTVDHIRHPLVREGMKLLGIHGGVEITSVADIPGKGTGLGSSSSFTVGLLHALHAFSGRYAGAEQLASEACAIEIERCGEPIGKQDQYAAAYGGLNFIEFHSNDAVSVHPILCQAATLRELEAHTLVFYTGITRRASTVLRRQQGAVAGQRKKQKVLQRMVELAHQLRRDLQANRVEGCGELIHEGWMLKRSLAEGISSEAIDRWYDRARAAGARGGKLLGAGTGGFLLFYTPPDRHEAVARALAPLRRVNFQFEPQGSRIIFVHR
jgi:D-glycero-alpha-D-manno-heptose-7-phosphate kinase